MEAEEDSGLSGCDGDAGNSCSQEEKKVAAMRAYVERQDPAAKVMLFPVVYVALVWFLTEFALPNFSADLLQSSLSLVGEMEANGRSENKVVGKLWEIKRKLRDVWIEIESIPYFTFINK